MMSLTCYPQEGLWRNKIVVSFGKQNRVKEAMEIKEAHDKDYDSNKKQYQMPHYMQTLCQAF